jgi:hypothetical protein
MRTKKSQVLNAVGVTLVALLAAGLVGCNEPAEQATGNDPVTVVTNDSETTDYAAFAAEEVQRAFSLTADSTTQGIAVSTVYYCSSPSPRSVDTGKGSITVTVDDVAPVGRSTGDSYNTTYNKCVQAGRTLDGKSWFELHLLVGDPTLPPPTIWQISTIFASNITIASATSSRIEDSQYIFYHGTEDGGVTYRKYTNGISGHVVTRAGVTTRKATGFVRNLYDNYNTMLYEQTLADWKIDGTLLTDIQTPGSQSLVGRLGTVGSVPNSGAIVVRVSTIGTGPVVCVTISPGGMVPGGGAAGGGGGAGGAGGGIPQTICNPTNTLIRATTITALAGGNARVDVDSNGDGVIDSTTTVPWSVATHDLLD